MITHSNFTVITTFCYYMEFPNFYRRCIQNAAHILTPLGKTLTSAEVNVHSVQSRVHQLYTSREPDTSAHPKYIEPGATVLIISPSPVTSLSGQLDPIYQRPYDIRTSRLFMTTYARHSDLPHALYPRSSFGQRCSGI